MVVGQFRVLLLVAALALVLTGAIFLLRHVGSTNSNKSRVNEDSQIIIVDSATDDVLEILPERFLNYDFDTNVSGFWNSTFNASSSNETLLYNETLSLFLEQTPVTTEPTTEPTTTRPTPDPTPNPTVLPPTKETALEDLQGALVTSDCLFENDYPYAIDIFWSCGDERFHNPLRLHTFKRHSRNHKRVFRDQRLTYRDRQLWFDGYNIPRCIRIQENNELGLTSSSSGCTTFEFQSVGTTNNYHIVETNTGRCVGLGGATCHSDRSTGARECGGVDHRFLPLEMGACNEALTFRFETEAEDCGNGRDEFPENACF